MKGSLLVYIKGILMGVADIIPGISGGTIALIVGIYERFIDALKSLNIRWVVPLWHYFLKRDKENLEKARKDFMLMDLALLIPLGLGIGTSFIALSHLMSFLLHDFPAYTYAFFLGLILASVRLLYIRIKRHDITGFLIGSIGAVLAVIIVGLPALESMPAPWFVFAAGFVSICAMLLPGISGSFILLLLGMYEHMINAIKTIDIFTIGLFSAGAVIGLLSFSRLISYLLKKHHANMLWFLTGLMVGALRMPLENVMFVQERHPELGFAWGILPITLVVVLFTLGGLAVTLIGRFDKD